MGTTPSSSAFMMKLNSSSKYSLTEGGYSDARISLTELGTRAAQADPEALVEAAMHPETFKAFYELLDGKRIPGPDEASGIVVDDIGIPEHLTAEFLGIVVGNGELVGIVTEVGNSHYVSLAELSGPDATASDALPIKEAKDVPKAERPPLGEREPADPQPLGRRPAENGRLLVAHSGGGAVANRIVRMLDDLDIPHGVVEIDPIDSSPLSTESSQRDGRMLRGDHRDGGTEPGGLDAGGRIIAGFQDAAAARRSSATLQGTRRNGRRARERSLLADRPNPKGPCRE